MLERLVLQNFQKHKRLDISFDRITTIIGPNDIGKSAVLRALRWVCLNSPSGVGIIRRGAKGAVAALYVDGRKVVRKRGPGVNEYWLDDEVYKAFGTGVPAPVAEFLNTADFNFQRQLDPPFWVGLPAGALAKEMNGLVDLEIIDRAVGALSHGIKTCEAGGCGSGCAVAGLQQESGNVGVGKACTGSIPAS